MPSYGERHHSAKLSPGEVREIRELREGGMRLREIGALFHISHVAVFKVANRISWAHVE